MQSIKNKKSSLKSSAGSSNLLELFLTKIDKTKLWGRVENTFNFCLKHIFHKFWKYFILGLFFFQIVFLITLYVAWLVYNKLQGFF